MTTPDHTMLTGSLDLIVLHLARQGDTYGYAIAREVHRVTQGEVELKEGSLYPALQRLEAAGELESYEGVSETGRRRKYYRITESGKKRLHEERAQWKTFRTAVRDVLQAASPDR